MSRIAFGSVIFEDNLKFFPAFLASLNEQTTSDFTLLLVNEGVENLDEIVSRHFAGRFISLAAGSNPQENRVNLLSFAAESFEFLVLGDTDDTFAPNRIEAVIHELKQFPVVVNELNHLRDGKWLPFIGSRFVSGQVLQWSDLLNKNFIGMSNSAIRTDYITRVLERIDYDTEIFDWHFFINMLSLCEGVFTNETYTQYRIHSGNLVGTQSNSKRAAVRLEIIREYIAKNKLYDIYLNNVYISATRTSEKLWWE